MNSQEGYYLYFLPFSGIVAELVIWWPQVGDDGNKGERNLGPSITAWSKAAC